MTPAERLLIESIPQAMAKTERVCSSVNVGSTRTAIDGNNSKLKNAVKECLEQLLEDHG